MSNVMKELKAEISRLARKEVVAELVPVKKVNAAQRGLIAALRRQVDALQKEVGTLKKAVPTADKTALAKAEPAGRFWITGKGVKALRKRLGLTQTDLARLAGVSGPAVVQWEKKSGKIGLRKATAGKLQEIRGLKKRDVAGMLGKGGKGKRVRDVTDMNKNKMLPPKVVREIRKEFEKPLNPARWKGK